MFQAKANASVMIIQRSLSIILAVSVPHCIEVIIIEPGLKALTCKGDLLPYPSTDMSGAEMVAERKAGSFQKSHVQSTSYTI